MQSTAEGRDIEIELSQEIRLLVHGDSRQSPCDRRQFTTTNYRSGSTIVATTGSGNKADSAMVAIRENRKQESTVPLWPSTTTTDSAMVAIGTIQTTRPEEIRLLVQWGGQMGRQCQRDHRQQPTVSFPNSGQGGRNNNLEEPTVLTKPSV
jgi:hypothetical protein